MKTRLTSANGTPASRLAFGTMQFGGRADSHQSHAMFDACIEAGVTHFDTAYVYTDGASETLLGGFLGDRRDDLIIATKAAYDGAYLISQRGRSSKRLGLPPNSICRSL